MQTATEAMDELMRHPQWRAFRKAFEHNPNSALTPEGQALIAFDAKLRTEAKARKPASDLEMRRKIRELQELNRRWRKRAERMETEAASMSDYRTRSVPHEMQRRRDAAAAARANKPRPCRVR